MPPEMRGTPRLTGSRSLVGRIVGALVTLGALVLGLMFSVVLFGVALVVGLGIWGWIWWKMRKVMRQAQQDPRFQQFQNPMENPPPPPGGGQIIEGEVLNNEWKDPPPR